MSTYKVELNWPEQDGANWVIRGLQGETYDGEIEPDTTLWSMDNGKPAEHYIAGEICAIYGALYDEVNTNASIQNGDIFEVQAAEVPLWHTYDRNAPRFVIPAMRFRRKGCHAVPADDATAAILTAAANELNALKHEACFADA